MRLTLIETSRAVRDERSDEVCGYDVSGLPAGEHAKIAYLYNEWRVLRWNDEWHGNWSGHYANPGAAIEALRDEILMPALQES
jgi:hypothetical protein